MLDQGRPFFFIWSGALAPPAARCGARVYKEGPLRSKPNPTPQPRARGRDFLVFGATQARRLPRAAARESIRKGLYVLSRVPRITHHAYSALGYFARPSAFRHA